MSISKWEIDNTGGSLIRLHRLFATGYLLDFKNTKDVFSTSVFIETLVHLSDLLKKMPLLNLTPVEFTNEIQPFKGPTLKESYENVTQLIQYFRNGACHIGSPKRLTLAKPDQTAIFVYVEGTKKYLD